MKRILLICISTICLLSSCTNGGKDDGKGRLQSEENLMRRANYIEITRYKSGYRLDITCPWDNQSSLGEFFLSPSIPPHSLCFSTKSDTFSILCLRTRTVVVTMWTNEYFLDDAYRKLRFAAEGVTLSGVRRDEDCRPTELWRNPLNWVPKVQSVHALISQAKGQS